jgi:formamidopyrimidine-DNA glycosylase
VPELPDITVYLEALDRRVTGRPLEKIRFASPFLLRTVDPPIADAYGRTVAGLRRLGKRIVFDLGDTLFLVIHLMIAGRLQWKDRGASIAGKIVQGALDFPNGTLLFTEASSKKRASMHLVRGEDTLESMRRGGIEPLETDYATFKQALVGENHTLKRSLTDPDLFSGIGNAYSDEILHAAKLSPVRLTQKMPEPEIRRLFDATRSTLTGWIERLRAETGEGWPEKVTAFRPEMATHGKFGKPCPVCGTKIQRIVHAENETNYCPVCQTGGKLLADRGLSKLLHGDWPKSIEEMEMRKETARASLPLDADDGDGVGPPALAERGPKGRVEALPRPKKPRKKKPA